MTFDPSISFGAILNAGVLLVGFVVAFTRVGGRIDLLAQRMESVEITLKDQKDYDKRLTIVERDISDLRRGEGFITGHRRQIDGEYP